MASPFFPAKCGGQFESKVFTEKLPGRACPRLIAENYFCAPSKRKFPSALPRVGEENDSESRLKSRSGGWPARSRVSRTLIYDTRVVGYDNVGLKKAERIKTRPTPRRFDETRGREGRGGRGCAVS